MWIFCCGMIRAGSTLQYQVISHLIESSGLGNRAGYFTKETFVDIYKDEQNPDYFRVVKMHDYLDLAGSLLSDNHAKAIYSYRDIRDVAVSSMRKFNISFETLIAKGWLDYTISVGEKWKSCANILVSRYENLVQNPSIEFNRMAKHINIILSSSCMNDLVKAYSLDSQLERVKRLQNSRSSIDGANQYDEISLLHTNHIHKGEIGGWKRYLSKDQVDILNIKYEEWLIRNDYFV